MMITEESEFRAEIESALLLSLESIRDAVNAGAMARGDLVHERLWIMAARDYSDASDYIEARGLTPNSGPLWLVKAEAEEPLALGAIQDWLDKNQQEGDAAFVFPEMPLSGDFGYSVLFVTESKERAALFRTFHA